MPPKNNAENTGLAGLMSIMEDLQKKIEDNYRKADELVNQDEAFQLSYNRYQSTKKNLIRAYHEAVAEGNPQKVQQTLQAISEKNEEIKAIVKKAIQQGPSADKLNAEIDSLREEAIRLSMIGQKTHDLVQKALIEVANTNTAVDRSRGKIYRVKNSVDLIWPKLLDEEIENGK